MPAFRYEHGHFGLEAACDVDHLVGCRHFEIELDLRQRTQFFDVGILDVTAIFAQMNGDAVCAADMGFDGRPDGIGFVGAPRLTDSGHVVDVYAEFNHGSCSSLKILRDSSSLPPV